MGPDLRRRVLVPEWMDAADVAPDDVETALRDLAVVNALTRAYAPTLGFLREAVRRHGAGRGTLRVVDIGGGGGDALRCVARWARRRRIALDLVSLDRQPHARAAAEAHGFDAIRYVTADVFDWEPDAPVDLVISSLFAHHLDDGEVVRFLQVMERTARVGWFVNDLHRHAVPFHAFRLWSRLAGWHRFVRHDGPVSIGRAFRRRDWDGLVRRAGLPPGAVRISRHVPFRLCVGRLR